MTAAAVALLALAGTASASRVTWKNAGGNLEIYTNNFKTDNEGKIKLTGSYVTVECNGSSIEGTIERHGAVIAAGGALTSWTFNGCNFPVVVNKPGSLEILTQEVNNNGNGTVISTGAEITVTTSVGQCIFTTNSTDLGLLTGSTNKLGLTATFDLVN